IAALVREAQAENVGKGAAPAIVDPVAIVDREEEIAYGTTGARIDAPIAMIVAKEAAPAADVLSRVRAKSCWRSSSPTVCISTTRPMPWWSACAIWTAAPGASCDGSIALY